MQGSTAHTIPESRRLTCILAADICRYSQLSETDEVRAIQAVNIISDCLSQVVEEYGGRIFNRAGDGLLAEFPSANHCVRAAIKFVNQIDSDATLNSGGDKITLRVGLHVGDAIEQKSGDLLGHGVNVAARLQQSAKENAIFASANIVNLVSADLKRQAGNRRSLSLKNIDQSIDAFEISLEEAEPPKQTRRLAPILAALALGGVAILIGVSFWLNPFGSTSQSEASVTADKVIDRRAIRAALSPLVEFQIANDAAVSALIETNDFNQAITLLRTEYMNGLSTAPQPRQIELLHQIGALAFDRDQKTALEIYRQIHKAEPADHLATLQLARIYNARSEKGEATRLLEQAVTEYDLLDVERWMFGIELARINAPPWDTALEQLTTIAEEASRAGKDGIALDARTYAITYATLDDIMAGRANEQTRRATIEDINVLIDELEALNLDRLLSRNYIAHGVVHIQLADLPAAIQSYEAALAIEEILERPNFILQILTNLAETYFFEGKLEEANASNDAAIKLAVEQDILVSLHVNKLLRAKIIHAQGRISEACEMLLEARRSWPAEMMDQLEVDDIGSELNC